MTNEMVKAFETTDVALIINDEGAPLFELYSTGMALGQVKTSVINGKEYIQCRKDRVDKNVISAEIKPLVHNGLKYLTESQLYDLMLEMKTDKVKPFRKWLTNDVIPSIRKTGSYTSVQRKLDSYMIDDPAERARRWIEEYEEKKLLETKNELLVAETLTWADRPLLNAIVRRYAGSACNGEFAVAWTEFKKEILYRYSINVNARITAYLNKTGKKTKPKTLEMISDDELVSALKTVISMCEYKGVNISDLLIKKKDEIA